MPGILVILSELRWLIPRTRSGAIDPSFLRVEIKSKPFSIANGQRNWTIAKEIWAFGENRIAVRFAYEWHDDSGNWYRSYGNENWEFNQYGLMARRIASINDLPIMESDRKYHWDLGIRPANHPGLSDLGL
jgi:nuclear transport factor 2 (NTF2) superfamily protein